MRIDVWGMSWCGTCAAVQKHLKAIDLPFTYHALPPGPDGWKRVEELSGRRATPVVAIDGAVVDFMEFKRTINALGRTPRELTQDELDEIE